MLLIIVIQTFYAFAILFIACELCQRVNLAFDQCRKILNRFKWYLFPMQIQRMLPILIHFAQQPIEIKWFGSKACDRKSYKYVSKPESGLFIIEYSSFFIVCKNQL